MFILSNLGLCLCLFVAVKILCDSDSLSEDVDEDRCIFVVSLKCIFQIKMSGFEELFSLEDDECSKLFITQEPKNNITEILEKTDENLPIECGKFLGTYGIFRSSKFNDIEKFGQILFFSVKLSSQLNKHKLHMQLENKILEMAFLEY